MADRAFIVSGVGISHKNVPIDDLEVASNADWRERINELQAREGVTEAVVIQTCNRVEEYVVTQTPEEGQTALADFGSNVPEETIVWMDHRESLKHLLRVAAGLESQILGEDEILGQVRKAYLSARQLGAIGPILDAALLKSIHVGERARTETAINEGIVSLGSAAIELANRTRGLAGSTVVIIGAGEMATAVIHSLSDTDTEIRVINRSLERAQRLLADHEVTGECDDIESLPRHLEAADIVISSTGSTDFVVDTKCTNDIGETLFIDLAQPRDINPAIADRPGITVQNLDALRAVTAATHRDRQDAAKAVETIVTEEFDLLLDQYKRKRADAVIASMYQGAERIKEREVQRAIKKLNNTNTTGGADQEIIQQLADSLVSQLLSVPTQSLRDAAANDDWETITSAIELFEPDIDDPADFFSAIEAIQSYGSTTSVENE